MSADRGGEAKAIQWADGAATEGNRESAPHLSPGAVPVPMYPEPVGRGGAAADATGQGCAPLAPPPAPCVGSRTEIHLFSCHDEAQHERAVVGGCIVASLDGGAGWLVRLDRPVEEFGGQLVEGPYFPPPGDCPNARQAAQRAA